MWFLTRSFLHNSSYNPPPQRKRNLAVKHVSLTLSVFKCVHHPNRESMKAEVSAMDGDPSDGDRAVRRPRRYITPGDSRLSERFRTQPITSAERLESDR